MSGKVKPVVQILGATVLMVAVLFGLGVAIGYFSGQGDGSAFSGSAMVVVVLFAMIVMGMGFWAGMKWMNAIDEAAQEAHKWAWYWGGSAGMAVGGVLLILLTLPQAEPLLIPSFIGDRTDPAAYVAQGAFGMMSLMLIGYIVAWVLWWLRRR